MKTSMKQVMAVVAIAFGMLVFQSCSDSKKTDDATSTEKIAPKKSDAKAMKCAPGKCGDAMKADKTDKAAKKDGKCGEGKCGDGKCGDSKAAKETKETK